MAKKSSKGVIFSVVFLDLLGFGIMIPMLPFYAREFGASAVEIGFLMFVYSFIQIFVAPLWGRMSDSRGRRPILLLTILGQAGAFALAGFATSYTVLLVSRILAGFFAANISTANAYMADITSKEDRAKGMGLIGAAFGLGFVFGPAIGGFLIEYGYEWPSFAASILLACNFVWALFVLSEPDVDKTARKQSRRRFSFAAFRNALEKPQVFMPIFIFFLLTLAFVQLEITFGLFVLDRFDFSERSAGFLLAGLGIIMALVQGGAIGRLKERFGEYKLVLFGCVAISLGLVGVVAQENLAVFIFGLFSLAVGYSLTNPCLNALTSKSASADEQGGVLGLMQSSGSIARVIGPISAGLLYDFNLTAPFLVGAVLAILSAGLWLAYRLRIQT